MLTWRLAVIYGLRVSKEVPLEADNGHAEWVVDTVAEELVEVETFIAVLHKVVRLHILQREYVRHRLWVQHLEVKY